MKPSDGSKEDNRRRWRRRPNDSFLNFLMENIGAHALTEYDHRSSAQARSHYAVLAPSQQGHAPLSMVTADNIHATTTRLSAEASSLGTSSPRCSPDTRRHTGKRRASGEMIERETESKTMQPVTLQGQGDEIRRPDIPDRTSVSSVVHSNSALEAETPREQLQHGNEHHAQAIAALPLRMSTRRTTTTMRWSPSIAGGRHQRPHRTSKEAKIERLRGSFVSPGSVVTPPNRPISNATQNINFDMLQPHFERPLQQAADSFCVCTTLLKKICRRNGINNWPYRKICGLRKSIASMAKQVNYFDGEQKRAYADQLKKLEDELQAYLRTGNEPTKELLRHLDAEAAAEQQKEDTVEPGIENEEKEVQAVPAWSTRRSFEPPRFSNTPIAQGLPTPPSTTETSMWGGTHFCPRELQVETLAFPTTAIHHRVLPSIASILQHQNYSSPSRAASTQSPSTTTPGTLYYERNQCEQPHWRYFPPTNDDAT